jgi:hypothetical protein
MGPALLSEAALLKAMGHFVGRWPGPYSSILLRTLIADLTDLLACLRTLMA